MLIFNIGVPNDLKSCFFFVQVKVYTFGSDTYTTIYVCRLLDLCTHPRVVLQAVGCVHSLIICVLQVDYISHNLLIGLPFVANLWFQFVSPTVPLSWIRCAVNSNLWLYVVLICICYGGCLCDKVIVIVCLGLCSVQCSILCAVHDLFEH